MKSGPTLAGATRRPRARSAAIRPLATVVLPTPEWVPAMTRRGPSSMLKRALRLVRCWCGQHLVEACVALVDTGLHATGERHVACLHARVHLMRDQSRATVDVFEGDRANAYLVRRHVELECLNDDAVRLDRVEHAREAVLDVVGAAEGVLPAAAAARVELETVHFHAARPGPLREEHRIGMGAEHGRRCCVEFARDLDEGQTGRGGDGG